MTDGGTEGGWEVRRLQLECKGVYYSWVPWELLTELRSGGILGGEDTHWIVSLGYTELRWVGTCWSLGRWRTAWRTCRLCRSGGWGICGGRVAGPGEGHRVEAPDRRVGPDGVEHWGPHGARLEVVQQVQCGAGLSVVQKGQHGARMEVVQQLQWVSSKIKGSCEMEEQCS